MKAARIIVFIIPFIIACNTFPKTLKTPETTRQSIIAISIKTRSLIRVFTNRPDTVYFVQLDEDESIDSSSRIVSSNYIKGDYAYLIGAQPGKYAVVAVSYMKSQQIYSTFLNLESIGKTVVEVGEGDIVFAGKIVVDDQLKSIYQNIEKNGDKAQLHYYRLLQNIVNGVFYCGTFKDYANNNDMRLEFYRKSMEVFKGTGWIELITKKIESSVKETKKEE